MKYIRKAVVVDAFKYDGDLKNSSGKYYVPEWAVKAFESGTLHYGLDNPWELFVQTIAGDMRVEIGDYVVMNKDNAIYSCAPEAFEEYYDPC